MGNEKLATIGARAGIGHRQFSGLIVSELCSALIFKTITGATRTGTQWTTALDHKVINDAVKGEAVIETTLCEIDKICHRNGCVLRVQAQMNDTFAGIHFCQYFI